MKYRMLAALVALPTLVSVARSRQPASDVLTPYLRRSYTALAKDLVAVVELMPAQDFDFRPPGVAKEVRTFGEIVAHIALVSGFACRMGDGKPASTTPVDSLLNRDKTRLLALLKETDTRCDAYLATLSDAALTQVVTAGTPPRELQAVRGNAMVFAIVHGNEHYGNLVTYLRVKGLVPPPAAAQAAFFSFTTPPKP